MRRAWRSIIALGVFGPFLLAQPVRLGTPRATTVFHGRPISFQIKAGEVLRGVALQEGTDIGLVWLLPDGRVKSLNRCGQSFGFEVFSLFSKAGGRFELSLEPSLAGNPQAPVQLFLQRGRAAFEVPDQSDDPTAPFYPNIQDLGQGFSQVSILLTGKDSFGAALLFCDLLFRFEIDLSGESTSAVSPFIFEGLETLGLSEFQSVLRLFLAEKLLEGGREREARSRLEILAEKPPFNGALTHLWARYLLGNLARGNGRYASAVYQYQSALEGWPKNRAPGRGAPGTGAPLCRAEILAALGDVWTIAGDLVEAEGYYRTALDIARTTKNGQLELRIEVERAWLDYRGGDWPKAVRRLGEILNGCRERGLVGFEAGISDRYGTALAAAGDFPAAVKAYERAGLLLEAAGNVPGRNISLLNLARVLMMKGDWERMSLELAMVPEDKLSELPPETRALRHWLAGLLYARNGDRLKAAEAFEVMVSNYEETRRRSFFHRPGIGFFQTALKYIEDYLLFLLERGNPDVVGSAQTAYDLLLRVSASRLLDRRGGSSPDRTRGSIVPSGELTALLEAGLDRFRRNPPGLEMVPSADSADNDDLKTRLLLLAQEKAEAETEAEMEQPRRDLSRGLGL